MSHSHLSIDHGVSDEISIAIKMICALTGEDPRKIAALPKGEIYDILSFLVKCDKDKLQKLFRKHDANTELDTKAMHMLWKLLEKGVVKDKKKSFLPLDEKVDESIRLNFARIAREIMIDPNRKMGTSISTMATTNTATATSQQQPTISLAALQNLVTAHKLNLTPKQGTEVAPGKY